MHLPNLIDSFGPEVQGIILSKNDNWRAICERIAKKIDLISKVMTPAELSDLFFTVKFKTDTQALFAHSNRYQKMQPDKREINWCIFDMLVYGHINHLDFLDVSTQIKDVIDNIVKNQPKDKAGQETVELAISRIIKTLNMVFNDKTGKVLDMFLNLSIAGDIDLNLRGYVKTQLLGHIYAHANESNYKTHFEAWWNNILNKSSQEEIFSAFCDDFCNKDSEHNTKHLFKLAIVNKLKEHKEKFPELGINAELMAQIIKTKTGFATSLLEQEVFREYLHLYIKNLKPQSAEKKEFNLFMLGGINPVYHNVGQIEMGAVKVESDEFNRLVDSGLISKALTYKALNFKLDLSMARYVLTHIHVNTFFDKTSFDFFMERVKEIENSHELAPYVLNLHASEEVARHYDWVFSAIEKLKLDENIENPKNNGAKPGLKI